MTPLYSTPQKKLNTIFDHCIPLAYNSTKHNVSLMKIKIRTYSPTDKKGIKSCIKELKKYEARFDPAYRTDSKSVDALFQDILHGKKAGGEIFVAEAGGEIVGFLSLSITNKNDELILKKVPAAYISDISVLPVYRGMGIGRRLLKSAYEFAKGKKISFVKLIVFSENVKAIKLYKREGFADYEMTMVKKIK